MTTTWYDTQPAEVVAVLDLAATRDNLGATAHDRILDLFAPGHAATVAQIAEDLDWIDRLGWDRPTDVLAAYHGQRVAALFADRAADELADRLRNDVLINAQLVASLLSSTRSIPVGA